MKKAPSPLVSLIPIIVLVLLLFATIHTFGSDALSGGSQVSLLTTTAVCILIGMAFYKIPWKDYELAITNNVAGVTTAIIILLIIGALSGIWMISGVVPTLIYYGMQIIHPSFFLASTCIICVLISVMTGSSWTTIATIGIALMGIGKAQGFEEGWIAGAIISGAYFGDKVSPLSETTILAASVMTLIAWLIFDPAEGVSRGLLAMVSVLVIACPCSLGLATPTALIAGIGNGARQGILIKDADSLQVARSIDAIVLDKTGTITKELKGDEIPTATSDFVDEVKETSAGAVAELKEMGLDVYMLSGDNPERAGKVAAKVGIDNVVSGVLPGDKQNFVRKLQAEGRKVGMAGDGINDSPALALADLSIAMGDGTDIAMNAAMVTIVTSDLKKISQLIKLSRRTFKIIKENLFWAFFYNVLAVPIAAGVLYPVNGFMLNPMIAAACMAMSSVCVVLNSLRLRK